MTYGYWSIKRATVEVSLPIDMIENIRLSAEHDKLSFDKYVQVCVDEYFRESKKKEEGNKK